MFYFFQTNPKFEIRKQMKFRIMTKNKTKRFRNKMKIIDDFNDSLNSNNYQKNQNFTETLKKTRKKNVQTIIKRFRNDKKTKIR